MTPILLWIDLILAHEGGFTQNPNDRGNWTTGIIGQGKLKGTKYGISAMSYPHLDIRNLTKEQAAKIYEEDFANKLSLEKFDDVVAIQLLDYAVNSGPKRAKKALQEVLEVEQDGWIGPKTMAAYEQIEPIELACLLLSQRLRFMASLKSWDSFGRGWARRIAKNLEIACGD